jgi:spermidine synthase/tetratricopeptide (TPR) repeat protein
LESLFGVAALACAGAGALALRGAEARSARARAAALAALVAACGSAWAAGPWNRTFLTMGTFRLLGLKGLSFANYRKIFEDYRLLFLEDGREASVGVLRFQDGQTTLLINGKADASTGKDMRTQQLLAHIPLLLRPRAERALVIGLGSGVTAGAALLHPLKSLDVVELSPGVARALPFFSPQNHDFLGDSRARLHLEDARTFVRGVSGRYDMIVSEPSNPWMAGVAGLFSAEFYRRCRGALAPGGVMGQWLHVYEMTDDTLALVARTFAAEFPRAELWHLYANDYLLVGFADAGPDVPVAGMEAEFQLPAVRADLEPIGLGRFPALLALQAAGDAAFRRAGGSGPLNRELSPLLEFQAARSMFLKGTSDLFETADEQDGAGALRLGSYLSSRRRPLDADEFRAICAYAEGFRRPFLRRLLDAWAASRPADAEPRLRRAELELADGEPKAAMLPIAEVLGRDPSNPRALERAADVMIAVYRQDGDRASAARAVGLLGKLAPLAGPRRGEILERRAAFRRELKDFAGALEDYESAAAVSRAPAPLWTEAAEMAWELDQTKRLVADLEKAIRADPEYRKAKDMLDYLADQARKKG